MHPSSSDCHPQCSVVVVGMVFINTSPHNESKSSSELCKVRGKLAGNSSFQFSGIAYFNIEDVNVIINFLYQAIDSPSYIE